MKKTLIILGIIAIIIIGAGIYSNTPKTIETPNQTTNPREGVVCTQEAKLCADGSYVARTGPNCEFAMCPEVKSTNPTKASLEQKILLSGTYITPKKVLEDSRCPVDVTCIQAGTVKIMARLEVDGKAEDIALGLNSTVQFSNKKITLVGVSPEANSKKTITSLDYVFTFKVEQVALTTANGTLIGHMTMGPMCGAQRLDDPCLPTAEQYATQKIYIYKSGSKNVFKIIFPDGKGDFKTSLPVGKYHIDMTHNAVGGITGVPTDIIVEKDKAVKIDINVDTGIL